MRIPDTQSNESKSPTFLRNSLTEPVLICVSITIISFITRYAFGFPMSLMAVLAGAFQLMTVWGAQLIIAILVLFIFRYFRDRDLIGGIKWIMRTLLIFFLLTLLAIGFSILKSFRNSILGFFADDLMVDLDVILHFGFDPWQVYAPILDFIPLGYIDHFYSVWWFYAALILTAVGAGLEQNETIRIGVFRTYVTLWLGLGLVVASAGMSVGPVFYDRLMDESGRFDAWETFVRENDYVKMRAHLYTERLWGWYIERHDKLGGGVAAFPSVHVAMATLAALYAFTINRIAGFLGLAWLAIIQVGSVMLGWHYAVDGYFSIVATILIWRYFVPQNYRGERFSVFGNSST